MSREIALTVGEAARRIERSAGFPEDYVARQLRTFLQRGNLEPASYRGSGRNPAAILDKLGLVSARILCALAHIGFSPDQMRQTAHLLRTIQSGPQNREKSLEMLLEEIIEEAREGKKAFFIITMSDNGFRGDEDIETSLAGGFWRDIGHCPFFDTMNEGAIVLPLHHLVTDLFDNGE